MAGKLYGIGIGPGDPELITLKAVRLLSGCKYLAVPGKKPKDTVAYAIVEQLDQKIDIGLSKKELLGIAMPMTKDERKLEESHRQAAEEISSLLKLGQDVAFLTLGDPCIYSTYMYVHERIKDLGYEVEIVNGISSFLAAAGKASLHLGSKQEEIHIIPASYDVKDALKLSGTKIFMKAGREYVNLKKILLEEFGCVETPDPGENIRDFRLIMVENCGMQNEAIYQGLENFPETAGYYTIIYVKDGK